MDLVKVDIAIDAGHILCLDKSDSQITNGTILIKNQNIHYMGSRLRPEEYETTEYIDATKSVVLPPFYNQHTHPSLALYRGLGVDMVLQDWLEKMMKDWNIKNDYLKNYMPLIVDNKLKQVDWSKYVDIEPHKAGHVSGRTLAQAMDRALEIWDAGKELSNIVIK